MHLAVASVLALFVGAPLVVLILTSLRPGAALPFEDVGLTPSNYLTVFADPSTYRLLGATLVYAIGSTGLAVAIAGVMAFLVERTNMPLRNGIYSAMLASMALPPLVITFGWVLLLDQRIGLFNVWLRNLLGSRAQEGPLDIYSLWGMVFVTGLAIAPTFFLMLAGLLRRMDGALEEAGRTAGASALGAIRRVTLPLLTPGLGSVVVYGMLILIQAFEVPLALGVTAGFPVLSLRIYILTQPDMTVPRYGLAATFGMLALVIGILLMLGYYRIVRVATRFQVITGKGYRPRRFSLGRATYPALAGALAYLLLAIGLPLLILFWATLMPGDYQPPSLDVLPSLGLSSYARLFAYPKFLEAVVNTVIVVVLTSTTTVLLATLVAWLSVRSRTAFGKVLDVT
ncbi:MAG TPA: ABC transporter permease subunit, partial [Chloroflexota bacterium]|nr:ABC transporter permease subunit [Chloroflexota bacterium]